MQGDDIFYADQNLAPDSTEPFSKNEVRYKFKAFLKVSSIKNSNNNFP